MKKLQIFVSTTQTQGERDNDFCFVPEGELVTFTAPCDKDSGDPDGPCGCNRSMDGILCRKGTTTAKVVNTDMSIDEYANVLWEADRKALGLSRRHRSGYAAEVLEKLLMAASAFPVGSVVEYRGTKFTSRVLGI